MINPQGTSFIPQRPTKGKTNTRRVRKIYVLTYISYVLFFGAVLAAAGTFFFNILIEGQLESVKQALTAEREKFSQSDIESVRELDKKIKIAGERLNNHISVVSVFEALEMSAVQSLRFIEFSYKRLNDEAPIVVLKGTTGRFDSVIFKRDVLLANAILSDSHINEVALESVDVAEGEDAVPNIQQVITFDLNNQIEPSLISYKPRFGEQPAQAPEAEVSLDDTASSSQESAAESSDTDVSEEIVEDQADLSNQNQ